MGTAVRTPAFLSCFGSPGSELTPVAGLQQHHQCLHPQTLHLPVSQTVIRNSAESMSEG